MILKRLEEFIKFKKISISAFERSIGMANSSFGKSLKRGGAIGTDKLENILSTYPEINPVWILTGKGPMCNDAILEDKTLPVSEDQTVNILLSRLEKLAAENARLTDEINSIKQNKEYTAKKKTSIAAEPVLKMRSHKRNK